MTTSAGYLTPTQFAALTTALFLIVVGALGFLVLAPSCDYAEKEGLPRLQLEFGFQGSVMDLSVAPGITEPTYVITAVTPGGALAEAGFQTGDIPASFHGYGSCSLLGALEDSAAGRPGEVAVVRDWSAGASTWHRLTVAPRPRRGTR